MDVPTLFWPISRDIMRNETYNTVEVHRLRSLIAYQILFGGRLVVRETDYLNTLAFRKAMMQELAGEKDSHSTFLRTLLDERLLIIAQSKERTLAQAAEGMSPGGRSPIVPAEWYRPDALDIVYLESRVSDLDRSMEYSVTSAAAYYTRQIERLLGQSLRPYLDDEFRLRVAACVSEHLVEHGTIGWAFFREDEFWKAFSAGERQTHGHFVDYTLAQAPHAGFIPDALGLNPVYMHDLVASIDLWRGRHLRPAELVEHRTVDLGRGFSFSDYVEYLSLLSVDSIRVLLGTEESLNFRNACERFALQRAGFPEVVVAYAAYRAVIDAELLRGSRMLDRRGGLVDLRAFLRRARDDVVEHGVDIVSQEVLGAAIPFWKLGLTLFYRIVRGEWPDQRRVRLARESLTKDISRDVQRVQIEGEKLDMSLISDIKGIQDRHIDSNMDADVCIAETGAPPS
jgi:hypothetical protein